MIFYAKNLHFINFFCIFASDIKSVGNSYHYFPLQK